ncbi:MAG: hypothetical protein JO301_01590 [Chitinophagaceae bacterium]|nr:hypothetical protein [Chitinophagaceae bacterium]
MRSAIVIAMLGFGACQSPEPQVSKADSLVTAVKTETVERNIKKKVLGIWTTEGAENAVFDIRTDSIYYVDQFVSYKYELTDSVITINYPDGTFRGIIRFKKDTMLINGEAGEMKYWKFKK